jgi:hypothetical protein
MHSMTIWILAAGLTKAIALTSSSEDAADTKELTRLEQVWNAAHIQGDAGALNSLRAEGFVVTVPRMPAMSALGTLAVGVSLGFPLYLAFRESRSGNPR